MDNGLFGRHYEELFLQLNKRRIRIMPFIVAGAVRGYILVNNLKKNQKIEIANWRVRIYENVTDYLKTLVEKKNSN